MKNTLEKKSSVEFRISAHDRIGISKELAEIFFRAETYLKNISGKRVGANQALFIFHMMDENKHDLLIELCRGLQGVNGCNHLTAQFIKEMDIEGSEKLTSIVDQGEIPFESFFSGQLIQTGDPLHPDNISLSDLEPAYYELDKAASNFIQDPDRLFKVKPSELEKIVAEVYRAQGFDVKVTGGPQDHGIDVQATTYVPLSLPKKFTQCIKVGIQVKRYRYDNKVGESELRNLYGSIMADNYDRGVLVTTSSITSAAAKYLETRRPVKDRITVIAGEEIVELLISYCKQRFVPFWDNSSIK